MKYSFFIMVLLYSLASYAMDIDYVEDIKNDKSLMDIFTKAIETFHVDLGCDTTIEACIKLKPELEIAPRLKNFTAWLVTKKDNIDDVYIQLSKRGASFTTPDTFSFSRPVLETAGDSSAPITITAYVSAGCPHCRAVCIPLYLAVTKGGPLYGKAKLNMRPITTRYGDRGLIAFSKSGNSWKYFLSLENEDRRLDEKVVLSKIKKVGIKDKDNFKKVLNSEQTVNTLLSLRKEAVKNGVQLTPTIFLNNRRYQSYKDPQWIIDAVEYEFNQLTKNSKK